VTFRAERLPLASLPPSLNVAVEQLDPTAKSERLRAELLRVLASQVGVVEVPLGSNDGPEVRQYHRATGSRPGDPWCAALQHWAFAQIGQRGQGAWCPSWFPKSRRVSAEQVRSGDQIGIYFTSLGRIAHIGTVERVERRECRTIEGNTNAQGSREGDRCARRIRDRAQGIYARWL